MSAWPPPGAQGPRRGGLIAALVVAVVLLIGSVAATIAWADGPDRFGGPVVPDRWDSRWDQPGGPADREWFDRMGDMHEWMHGDDDRLPPWLEEESPTPTPSS